MQTFGPQLLVRALSVVPAPKSGGSPQRQYNSRSDRHSKIACWLILFDLLRNCPLLASHATAGSVGFGINHSMRDFTTGRKKNLDLVICTPRGPSKGKRAATLEKLAERYEIPLSGEERGLLKQLPDIAPCDVGEVLVALEAKACMTAHSKARPRLHDELSASHQTIHGSSEYAIAVGFVMVNNSERFISSVKNGSVVAEREPEFSTHKQPKDTLGVIEKIRELQRRSSARGAGFDALGLVVVSCANDGSEVRLVSEAPGLAHDDVLHYDSMIQKVANHYQTRFQHR